MNRAAPFHHIDVVEFALLTGDTPTYVLFSRAFAPCSKAFDVNILERFNWVALERCRLDALTTCCIPAWCLDRDTGG